MLCYRQTHRQTYISDEYSACVTFIPVYDTYDTCLKTNSLLIYKFNLNFSLTIHEYFLLFSIMFSESTKKEQ